ncbi:MAG: DUF2800 domain-containing protein [Bacteroidales bacterium]|nr:DUF2800 domain-containing protein [Bacteroidales bacterium]
MAKHAFLAASASERWLHCPPSAKLCAQEDDQGSEYARQGSDAHALCEHLLLKALGRETRDPTEDLTYYDAEMQEAAEAYAAFVMEQVAEAKTVCHDPLICVEQTVDFSKWVQHGFGTADALIVADDTLYITDMKYGVGCLVTADGEDGTGNSQLKCYALGAIDTFGDLYDINRIRLSIFQPRRDNVDTFELTKADLLQWADDVLAPIAKLAYEGQGEFEAGNHCQFCRVKATCRKRAEYAMELAKYEFADAPTLDENEIAEILPQIDTLVSWAEDIKSYALNQALSGVRYPGFKLVAGRSNRKYADEAAVARVVSEAGYDPYDKKLVGITEMTKRLGKNRFEELLNGLLIKPEGKPVLVPVTDTRPELNNAKNDFMEE